MFALLFALVLAPFALAFSVGVPSPGWISPGNNTLTWTTDSNDPALFNVFVIAQNASILNGAYGILSSVPSSNGSAKFVLPPVPLSVPYSIAFTSVTNNTDVLASSPLFAIVANASQLSTVSQIVGSQTGSPSVGASATRGASASASASTTRASSGPLTVHGLHNWVGAGALVALMCLLLVV